LKAKRQKH